MSNYYIRVNGVGNAWPVPLGMDHPFYDHNIPEQLANVSFSLLKSSAGVPDKDNTDWEVLIDAGHGIVQYLIRNGNRLPDAAVLTHAHLDHTLSLDWIIQSYYRHHKKNKKFPLYSSSAGWDFLATSFPQLPALTDHQVLIPGQTREIDGIPEIRLTPFPVFHGDKAPGPMMLVFEFIVPGKESEKIIFSGDLLCPLLNNTDYLFIKDAGMAFLDANNRFPYTSSNHWSISGEGPDGKTESKFLKSYRQQIASTQLFTPQFHVPADAPFSVFEFCNRVNPKNAMLVHYSGMEDLNHNNEDILNPVQLENWANAEAERRNIKCRFLVPKPGDLFTIS